MQYIIICLALYFFACSNKPSVKQNSFEENVVTYHAPSYISKIDTSDFVSKINDLKTKIDRSFTISSNPYFIIASNLTPEETQEITDNTIAKAIDCFYNDYFEKSPDEITTIFLFKDDATYRYWAKKLYNDDDLSRFGYYKPSQHVMLMNISTGTGTLVHELTHAFVRFDFPDVPAWFNEGLGSLYERCSLNNKNIKGYVNWRLPRLQEAINKNEYQSIEKLVKIDDDTFYGADSDLNYAQARYLCMYMQEKNVLKTFYKSFRDGYNKNSDAKSYLETIFAKSINEIDKDFLSWVKTLRYEE
jgi:hypothetical protein